MLLVSQSSCYTWKGAYHFACAMQQLTVGKLAAHESALLQVVFPTELDKANMTFDASADMKRIGGPIALDPAQQVTVQVYVDHSAVEIFLSSGEALATRCADIAGACDD